VFEPTALSFDNPGRWSTPAASLDAPLKNLRQEAAATATQVSMTLPENSSQLSGGGRVPSGRTVTDEIGAGRCFLFKQLLPVMAKEKILR
jgi:hypothetical protein